MDPKRLLNWVVVGFLLFNLLLMYLVLKPAEKPPQVVSLWDGSRLELEAVTYGTNHTAGSALARATSRLPSGIRPWMLRLFGAKAELKSKFTAQPALVVWCKLSGPGTKDTAANYFMAVLTEEEGDRPPSFFLGPNLAFAGCFFTFTNLPTNSAQLELRLLQYRAPGQTNALGSFRFENPRRGKSG